MNKAAFKHHRSSPAADDGGLWLQVRSVHDAGGGDGEGSQIESQENTHIQQEQQYLKSYTHTHTQADIIEVDWVYQAHHESVCNTGVHLHNPLHLHTHSFFLHARPDLRQSTPTPSWQPRPQGAGRVQSTRCKHKTNHMEHWNQAGHWSHVEMSSSSRSSSMTRTLDLSMEQYGA